MARRALLIAALVLALLPAAGALEAPVVPLHDGTLSLDFEVEVDTCVPFHCDFFLTPTFAADGGTFQGVAFVQGSVSCDTGSFRLWFASDGIPGTVDASGPLGFCEADTWDSYHSEAVLLLPPGVERAAAVGGLCSLTSCRLLY